MVQTINLLIQKLRLRLGEFARRAFKRALSQVSWHSLFLEDFIMFRPGHLNYLEIGIYQAETFNRVSKWAKYAVGIDIKADCLQYIRPRGSSIGFVGTLQDFIESPRNVAKFDLIFIDGDHRQESVVADFQSALKVVADQGIILLHDTWPGSREYSSSGYCGDAYLAVDRLRKLAPEWSFVTIPVHPGLTICQRVSDSPESMWAT